MSQDFQPGDFLIFQLESAFGLLRVIDVEVLENKTIWHLAVYKDLFFDVDMADAALERTEPLGVEIPHAALTQRAFESTQVSKMRSVPLTANDLEPYQKWKSDPEREILDRSIRLILGLR